MPQAGVVRAFRLRHCSQNMSCNSLCVLVKKVLTPTSPIAQARDRNRLGQV